SLQFSHSYSSSANPSLSVSLFLFFVDVFFFNDTPITVIYTLSLHDALPICYREKVLGIFVKPLTRLAAELAAGDHVSHQLRRSRSEEHTSELQSRFDLVCRLLLEKKKKNKKHVPQHYASA